MQITSKISAQKFPRTALWSINTVRSSRNPETIIGQPLVPRRAIQKQLSCVLLLLLRTEWEACPAIFSVTKRRRYRNLSPLSTPTTTPELKSLSVSWYQTKRLLYCQHLLELLMVEFVRPTVILEVNID